MALVRALGKRKLCVPFSWTSSNGNAALFSTTVPGVQYQNSNQVKPFESIPGPRGLYQWPVIGPLLHFKPFTEKSAIHASKVYTELLEKYGPIVKLRLGRVTVLISDPKDAEVLFRNEGKYPKRIKVDIAKVYAERNNFRHTLIDLEGEEWHTLRAPLNKRLMRVDSAYHYLPQQSEVADEFVDVLGKQEMTPDDLSELFFHFASESIGVVCFNARLGFLDPVLMRDPERAAFQKASRDVFGYLHDAVCGKSVAHTWYRNKTYRGFEEARLLIREQTLKHIDESKRVLEERRRTETHDPEEPNLIFSLLSDNALPYDDITNAMQTLYTGGTDSTAKNLMVLFYHLAKNPDKQEKLRNEVFSVLGRSKTVTVQSLDKMSYLKASLKESFRLVNPTVSGTGRVLPTDVVMSGYKIPAGTFIQIHSPKSSMEYFEQAEKFIPERWLRASNGQHIEQFPSLASLPFGFGPRNCVGRRFAVQEIYLATAKALQNLRIDIKPESMNTNFIHTVFVQPETPIKFVFTKLEN